MGKQAKEPIGEMECPRKGCNETASVFKYRQQAQNDGAKRFAGKLYTVCPGGHRCDDQDLIIENPRIKWHRNEKETAPDASSSPSAAAASTDTEATAEEELLRVPVGSPDVNTVEINQDELAREADSIVSDVPPDPSAQGAVDANSPEGASVEMTMEQIQAAAANWEPGCMLIVSQGFDTLAPAWRVTSEEKQRVAHAFALALAAWVPAGALPPKYLVLLMAGGSLYSVVNARRDPETGELMPRVFKKVNDGTVQPPSGSDSTGNTSTSGFSTAA